MTSSPRHSLPRKRILIALLVAPALPLFLPYLLMFVLTDISDLQTARTIGLALIGLMAICYLGAILIGIPLFIYFEKKGWRTIFQYLMMGIVGTFAFLSLADGIFLTLKFPEAFILRGITFTGGFYLISGLFLGMLTSLVFWVIVFGMRDKSSSSVAVSKKGKNFLFSKIARSFLLAPALPVLVLFSIALEEEIDGIDAITTLDALGMSLGIPYILTPIVGEVYESEWFSGLLILVLAYAFGWQKLWQFAVLGFAGSIAYVLYKGTGVTIGQLFIDLDYLLTNPMDAVEEGILGTFFAVIFWFLLFPRDQSLARA